MEIILNLAWAMLALSSVCLWIRLERRTGTEKRLPVIALLMLIVVLFPVISVSDDLWSLQNPAETDVLSRRGHPASSVNTVFPASAALCEPGFSGITLAVWHDDSLPTRPIYSRAAVPLSGIQNRPPPAA
jgi:hypothetical protein